MVKKSYFDIVKYPLGLWIIFDIVAFVLGFTSYVGVVAQIFLGSGSFFLALIFGAWVGRRTAKVFNQLWASALTAIMLIAVIGFVNILFGYGLSAWSTSFQTYMIQYGPQASLLSLVTGSLIAVWFQIGMIAIATAMTAAEFSTK